VKRLAGIATFFGAVLIAGLAGAADTLDLKGDLSEGGLVIGTTDPAAAVKLDGRPLSLTADGKFVFGFNRDAPKTAALDVVYPDGTSEHRALDVARTKYKIQRINGLPEKMVTPDPEQVKRINRENGQIAKARDADRPGDGFAEPFVWPAKGPISGIYGSQRILNGEPRAPHSGLDIAVPVGTELRAPAAGVVTLAQPDFYLTGGTLMIDHGHGLSSVFIHLSKIDVKVGQIVGQGEHLGLTGATGRVTGPHVHWSLYWFDNRLDPQRLLPPASQ
jgi:murein DD-endopeptidase MepM/ murein hydrolase activator NlpD